MPCPPANGEGEEHAVPEPVRESDGDRLSKLTRAMKDFLEDSFFEESSLRLLDRLSPHQQYKLYDNACSDLYGEIDEVIAKNLLDGEVPDEDSRMQEVLVELLDAAFVCAVNISGPREEFRRQVEAKCKRLVEIAKEEATKCRANDTEEGKRT
jgi:hypothetical protein